MKRLVLLALALMASPAAARTEVTPYLEIGQVLTADLDGNSLGGDEVLTYSTVAAGVDASIEGPRAEGQISYRYEHRFAWNDDLGDDSIHSGLARARADVARGLSVEGGAIATRARSGGGGAVPGFIGGDSVSQIYSAYAGPTLTTNVGDLAVTGAYRLGYTAVDDGDTVFFGGQPLDSYDHSLTHYAAASVGMKPGELPFGWQVSGAVEREDSGQLDQRFESAMIRADVTVPVSRTVAIVGGVGYEDIEISQRSPLIGPGGLPVINGNGRFVADPNSPRLLAYDQDGLIWDVGVLWRPSRRTSLEARIGRRYGSMTYIGSLTYSMSAYTGLQIGLYDSIESFGRQLNDNLVGLPTRFAVQRNPLAGNFGGCTFGQEGAAGGCLDDVFQSISTAQFRARGITAVLSTDRGRWNAGIGGGYSQRKFIAPRTGSIFSLDGVKDESWFAQAYLSRTIDEKSSVEGSLFGTYYDPGTIFTPDTLTAGATAAYYRTLGRRISATAALGLYTIDQDGFEGDTTASALIGMRYSF